jgi:hypothetical protein
VVSVERLAETPGGDEDPGGDDGVEETGDGGES